MNDKRLAMLSLCRKAGRLTCGYDPVAGAVTKGEAVLVLTAADLSQRSQGSVTRLCEEYKIKRIHMRYTMDDIERVLGRHTGIIAICDHNFAKNIERLFTQREGEESL